MYRLNGSFSTGLQMNCSRCLAIFQKPLNEDFDITFARSDSEAIDQGDDQDRELTAEEIETVYFDGEVIDIKDALQQQIVMSLPQRPLCMETCKGLCQQCGANLNEEDCRCTKRELDERFEILKSLTLKD